MNPEARPEIEETCFSADPNKPRFEVWLYDIHSSLGPNPDNTITVKDGGRWAGTIRQRDNTMNIASFQQPPHESVYKTFGSINVPAEGPIITIAPSATVKQRHATEADPIGQLEVEGHTRVHLPLGTMDWLCCCRGKSPAGEGYHRLLPQDDEDVLDRHTFWLRVTPDVEGATFSVESDDTSTHVYNNDTAHRLRLERFYEIGEELPGTVASGNSNTNPAS